SGPRTPEETLNLMDRFARALVRWRYAVLVFWAAVGVVAAVRAPATPGLLNIRGGSDRPTEASRTEDLLTTRFSRPIGEFFAITLQAPASFDSAGPRAALDTVLATLRGQPYVRGLVSYRSPNDTTSGRGARRATFVTGALEATRGDGAGALVEPVRGLLGATISRLPDGDRYRVRVTGRAPLDLDVRTVVARDSAEG